MKVVNEQISKQAETPSKLSDFSNQNLLQQSFTFGGQIRPILRVVHNWQRSCLCTVWVTTTSLKVSTHWLYKHWKSNIITKWLVSCPSNHCGWKLPLFDSTHSERNCQGKFMSKMRIFIYKSISPYGNDINIESLYTCTYTYCEFTFQLANNTR